jgi:hypothetical protein
MVTAGLTVMERGWTALTAPATSVTVAEKFRTVCDETEGAIPVNVPAAESDNPAGNPMACQVNGAVPPVSERVWL